MTFAKIRQFAIAALVPGAPLFVGAHFAVLLFAMRWFEVNAFSVAIGTIGVAVAIVVAAAAAVSAGLPLARRAWAAASIGIALVSASTFFLLVDISRVRYAVIVAAPLAAFFILSTLRVSARGRMDARADDAYAHVIFFSHVMTACFLLYVAFSINTLFTIHVAIVAASLAAIGALGAYHSLQLAGADAGMRPIFAAAYGLIFGEFFLGLQALPTAAPANAIVGTMLYAAAFHVGRLALSGAFSSRSWRREFAMMSLLVIMVLATAQWT